ncbi:MAG TPA: glyoxalase superfamily protein [Pyrinomonadaceae bacterium]|jgi:catechol 2,3-dioxygenase-like lactoylglutathione lyase family enzyme|nr:glyoxalase superfamily protein [Pyrinomonadaceae bacterium]
MTKMTIEVIFVPVTDVDRAKDFYVNKLGFTADHDHKVKEGLRFVQLTPEASACSIAFGEGITEMKPGTQQGVMLVVGDVRAVRQELKEKGVDISDIDEQPWGTFASFKDPDGNGWTLQQLPYKRT